MSSDQPSGPPLHGIRDSVTAAFVGPFLVFLVFVPIPRIETLFPSNSELSWWWSAPEHWLYPLQSVICLALLLFWWRHYPFRPFRGLRLGILAGIAGFAIWILPTALHAATGLGGGGHWLSWLGFRERVDGFDPTLFDRRSNPLGSVFDIGFRFLRLVIVVPLIEEIFWRGFLMRWLIDSGKAWHHVPVGSFGRNSFLLTTVLFALAHWGPDFLVALIYGALAGWVTIRTRSLTAVIVMHAVTNLLLGFYVMKTGFWGLW